MIRRETRTWLRLLKDTPLGLLHVPIKSGGLGIPNLGASIALLHKKKFGKLLTSQNPIEKALTELPWFKTILQRVNLPCKIGKEEVCTTEEAKEEWTKQLKSLANGRELVTEDIVGASYHWVEKPSKVFPRLHLRGIKLCGGVINTKTRAFRGRGRNPRRLNTEEPAKLERLSITYLKSVK